jgi:hypothetical protein
MELFTREITKVRRDPMDVHLEGVGKKRGQMLYILDNKKEFLLNISRAKHC